MSPEDKKHLIHERMEKAKEDRQKEIQIVSYYNILT